MKQWVLMFLTLCLAACAAEVLDAADDPTEAEVAAEELQFGCLADLAAKQYFQWYFNVDDSELHWYSEGYYQAGGAAYHQPVRARAYFERSVRGTRTMNFTICDPGGCTYYATYTCGCGGLWSCELQ